ncbi:hypothetical protein AMATHDRAFT_65078 [Amanita thiersii Skay4041]|uniref:Uncharacterized protein n=1 Tax=Amanita thiersii Skay4041 TaxID=703135 RepID=A0A2A9NLC3_9AGAR|nr:hypothetical protein AMATHDRAFT_65078 [Amanita thiersii Skay4041]
MGGQSYTSLKDSSVQAQSKTSDEYALANDSNPFMTRSGLATQPPANVIIGLGEGPSSSRAAVPQPPLPDTPTRAGNTRPRSRSLSEPRVRKDVHTVPSPV